MLNKLVPFIIILLVALVLLLSRSREVILYCALVGQVVGIVSSIPQWIRLYIRKSALDISLNSLSLITIMIALLGVQAYRTGANWLVIVNFGCSLTINIITALLVAYYQTSEEKRASE